jgi:ASC-1-like (ASCH) protein
LVLENFLLPGEVIIFQSGKIRTLNDRFIFYITDQRIVLHRRRGVVFKKDRVVSERVENIRTLYYDEKGLIRKWGVLHIETISKKMEPIEGKIPDIKAIWQELQKHIKREE